MDTLPLVLALLLPMGAFARVPLLNLSLVGLLLLFMAAAGFRCAHQDRLRRPPFEYWWPAVLLLPASLLVFLRNEGPFPLYLLQSVLAFLTALTLASNGTVACRAITAFGGACGVSALMHWGAEFSWIPPTVVAPSADLLLAGPETLESGLMTLFGGLLANIIVLIHPSFSRQQRGIAFLALLTVLSWLFLAPAVVFLWVPIGLHQLDAKSLILLLIILWISARIMARSLLQVLSRRAGRLMVIPIAIGLMVFLHLLAGTAPPVALLFLLGLLAALDAPWTEYQPSTVSLPLWAIPVGCVLLQLSGLLPLGDTDPRNQPARGERLLEGAQWDELNGMLACLLKRQPAHPDYSLLEARALLAQGWPAAAVEAYRASDHRDDMESPFQARNRRAFLDALRDVASAQPRGQAPLLFERALAHDDETEQVRNLLDIHRGHVRSKNNPKTDVETLRKALVVLLGTPDPVLQLKDWEASTLEAILNDAGVSVLKLPDGFPKNGGPFMLDAHVTPGGLCINVVDLETDIVHEFSLSEVARKTTGFQRQGGWAFLPGITSTLLNQTHENSWELPELNKTQTGRLCYDDFVPYHAAVGSKHVRPPSSKEGLEIAWEGWGKSLDGLWEIELTGADSPLATLRFSSPITVAFHTGSALSGRESAATVLYVP